MVLEKEENMTDLQEILRLSATRHSHLCPRQVLGARIGLIGADILGFELPRRNKKMLVIVETDGCFADGVEVATECTIGHRTLRIEDYGKVAATFINVETEQAVRIAPLNDVRQLALQYAPNERRHYFAQLQAYQTMPFEDLVTIQWVVLSNPVEKIVSRPGVRVNCQQCGEEIINEREIVLNGVILCQSCALGGYYQPAPVYEPQHTVKQKISI